MVRVQDVRGRRRLRAARRGQPGAALVVFAWVATVALFLVVVLGFVDTFTHSAFGCGHSFPLCHGSLLPGDNIQSVIEWSHRVTAATAGILVGVAAIWAWARAGRAVEVRVLAAIAVGFVLIESAVGALAVINAEPQGLIATHLGISLTAFAGTALLARVLGRLRAGGGVLRRPAVPRALAGWTWAMLVYMYAAIYMGAYVAGTGAGVYCLTWPLCTAGRATLSVGNPVTIDLVHRFVALVGGVMAVVLYAAARRARARRPDLAKLAHWVLALVVLQVASGLLLVLTDIAIEATILHVALATLLFTAVAAMALGVLPEAGPRPERAAQGS